MKDRSPSTKRLIQCAYEQWTRHGYYRGKLNVVVDKFKCKKSSVYFHMKSIGDLLEKTLRMYPISVFSLKIYIETNGQLPFFSKSVYFKALLKNEKALQVGLNQLIFDLPNQVDNWTEKDDKLYQAFRRGRRR